MNCCAACEVPCLGGLTLPMRQVLALGLGGTVRPERRGEQQEAGGQQMTQL